MTAIVSWNIQAGLGIDGQISLPRIASAIEALADADVICLQEIVDPGQEQDPGQGIPKTERFKTEQFSKINQFRALAELFPDHVAIEGPGIERKPEGNNGAGSGPYRFGNMILSRLPVQSVFRHLLPWPAEPDVKHMPRQATEVTVAASFGPLRIITTHLEYHAQSHRAAQVGRLRTLYAEAVAQSLWPGIAEADSPYAAFDRAASSVICGDFNMEVDAGEYAAMLAPFGDDIPPLIDAWSAVYPDRAHDPTCGIFDHVQWPAGAHCRDFFFVSEDLRPRLTGLMVDTETDASDHQPMVLILGDGD